MTPAPRVQSRRPARTARTTLPAFLNLGPSEFVIIAVVAVLIFGRRLPEVAGQAAGMVQRMRRSLDDLRRETGIDREIQKARRSIHEAVPREVRDLGRTSPREALGKALEASEVRPEEEIPGGLERPPRREPKPAQVDPPTAGSAGPPTAQQEPPVEPKAPPGAGAAPPEGPREPG